MTSHRGTGTRPCGSSFFGLAKVLGLDERGGCLRPCGTPLEMGVEQKAHGKSHIDHRRQEPRAAIDVVKTVLVVVIDQYEGYHEVDTCGEVQHGFIKEVLHSSIYDFGHEGTSFMA